MHHSVAVGTTVTCHSAKNKPTELFALSRYSIVGRYSNVMSKKELVKLPPVSDFSSRKEWEAVCWKEVVESEELLQLLITVHERHDIVMRAAAIDRLASGESYKKIGEELWLSPQTISGIRKAANEKTYRSYLERSKKERKKKTYSIIGSRKQKPKGTPRRTKYGTLYMP